MEEGKEVQQISDSSEAVTDSVEPTPSNNLEMEQEDKEIEQNPDSGDSIGIESIDRICEEVKAVSTTSFLVQLFGIHEVVESYENKNLLVSQSFRDLINNVESGKNVCCYFVFQDVRAFVGVGTISRKENVSFILLYLNILNLMNSILTHFTTSVTVLLYTLPCTLSLTTLPDIHILQEGDQEPYDLGVNWTRLTFLPYSELNNSDTAKSIVSSIEDDENINWEFKVRYYTVL